MNIKKVYASVGTLVCLVVIIAGSSCNDTSPGSGHASSDTLLHNWVSWNIVFKDSLASQVRQQDLKAMNIYLDDFVDSVNKQSQKHLKVSNFISTNAPDSTHYAVTADLVSYASDSVTNSNPGSPHPGPKYVLDHLSSY